MTKDEVHNSLGVTIPYLITPLSFKNALTLTLSHLLVVASLTCIDFFTRSQLNALPLFIGMTPWNPR